MPFPTIVIVDDDPDDYVLTATLLKAYNPRIHTLHLATLAEWDAFLAGQPSPTPSLILLDYYMMAVTGKELLAQLKQVAQLANVPVVVWSASAHRDQIEQSYDAGAAAFMSKPTSYAEFASVIESLCQYWLEVVRLPSMPAMASSD